MKISINSSVSYDTINNEMEYNKKPNNLSNIETPLTNKADVKNANKLELNDESKTTLPNSNLEVDYKTDSENFSKDMIKQYSGDLKKSQALYKVKIENEYI